MATIRCVLNNWGLAHNHGSDLSLRMAAAKILRDGCSSGGHIPTSEECRALEAFSRGASLDDPCPVDAADQFAILCAAIDDGDDTALLALADLLEEEGDIHEAIIWRNLYTRPLRPFRGGHYQNERWIWQLYLGQKRRLEFNVHPKYFERLTGHDNGTNPNEKRYLSRFDALNALVRSELEDLNV